MIELRRTNVAGVYEGQRQGATLELRVDVGEGDSLDVISGDLSLEEGAGVFEFHHSFQTTGLVLEDRDDRQLLRAAVKIHRELGADIARLDLLIPDDGELTATYTFYRLSQFGRQTALTLTFPLTRMSTFFRRVELEMEQVDGVPLPGTFETADHPETPPDLPDRQMDLQSVYRDAGIDLVTTVGEQNLPLNLAGPDGLWNNEELHAAMVQNFMQHRDEPQWRLYLLLATRHVSTGTVGIMFDSGDEAPRQGAAVFFDHPAIKGMTGNEREREYLYTMAHEVGHAFNMLHSFQKGIFETHGVLPRPTSLSWMNYPQLFPFGYAFPPGWDGSSSFWSQFRFQFDRNELSHLRHNDRAEVIMGGRSFGFAGHLEELPFEQTRPAAGLSLYLWFPETIEFLEQLKGDVRLRNDGSETIAVHPDLEPASGGLDLLIRRHPQRFPKRYRTFFHACNRADLRDLAPGEAVYQELSPSFGLRHWFLDEPGTYEVQAVYRLPDGRKAASQVRRVRVLTPGAEADRVAPDFFTMESGTYFGVEGSRIDGMAKVRDTLKEVRERLPKSAVAEQIDWTNSLRDARVFKDVESRKVVKEKRPEAARRLLRCLDASLTKKNVKLRPQRSNLLVNRSLRLAAQAFSAEGRAEQAESVAKTIENMLANLDAPQIAYNDLESFKTEIGV